MNAQPPASSFGARVVRLFDHVPRFFAALLLIAALQQVYSAFTDTLDVFLVHLTAAASLGLYARAFWSGSLLAVASLAVLLTLYLPLYLFVSLSGFAYVDDTGYLAPYGPEQHEPRVWARASPIIVSVLLLWASVFRLWRNRRRQHAAS